MNEPAQGVDPQTMKMGLLMESAQAHQMLAQTQLEQLRAHAQDLDGVVREEIRRTLVAEFESLSAEMERAAKALREVKRAVTLRSVGWNVGAALLCAAVPAVLVRQAVPSASDVEVLRKERDSLAQSVARLEQRGGKIEWRTCGAGARLCVRIDRGAPAYGDDADFYILKGY